MSLACHQTLCINHTQSVMNASHTGLMPNVFFFWNFFLGANLYKINSKKKEVSIGFWDGVAAE